MPYRRPSIAPKIFGGNLVGVFLTALTAVGTGLLLSLALTLMLRSSFASLIGSTGIPGFGPHTIFGLWAGSMFGADMRMTLGGGGMGQVALTVGFVPLGFTVLTLAVTVLVWRRVTSRCTSASTIVVDAIRAALVAAILMLIVALATTSSMADSFPVADYTVTMGTSAVGAFFSTLLVTAIVLTLAGLAGRSLFPGRAVPIASAIGAMVKGLAAFVVTATVLGLVLGLVSSIQAIKNLPSDLPFGGNLNGLVAAIAVAYSGTTGFWYTALGSFSSTHATINGYPIQVASRGLSDMASTNGAWWLLVLMPIAALAIGAFFALRGHRTSTDGLWALGTFCASFLIAVPILGYFANVRLSFTATGAVASVFSSQLNDLLKSLGVPPTSGNALTMSGGVNLVTATFLVFLFAVVVSFLVALISGVITQQLRAGRTAPRRRPPAYVTFGTPQATYPQPGGYPPPAGYGYQPPGYAWTPQPTSQAVPQPMAQPVAPPTRAE